MPKVDDERKQKSRERAAQKKANLAWSEQLGRKEEREKRKEKKARKKKWEKTQAQAGKESQLQVKRVREASDDDDGNDWDDLAREERMAKKVKRGDVSQKVFDEEFMELS